MHVASIGTQIDDGIADDLSGAVVGDVTTPSCLVDLDAQACELRIARGDVRPAAAPHAKRNDRRGLQEKQKIPDAAGAALFGKWLLHVERVSATKHSEEPDFPCA